MVLAQPVAAPIDRHIAPLVDAINRTGEAQTYTSCSGHVNDSRVPFVGFRTKGWGFIGTTRRMMSELNEVTRGQTLLEIGSFDDEVVEGVIRFRMYPWLWAPDINLAPLAAQLVFPPMRLVRLWWREVAELARMIEGNTGPSDHGRDFFARQQRSQCGFPWWGRSGVTIVAAPKVAASHHS